MDNDQSFMGCKANILIDGLVEQFVFVLFNEHHNFIGS